MTNREVYDQMVLTILKGFAVWRIKMFNDRIYLNKFRRSYWFGDRYYFMVSLLKYVKSSGQLLLPGNSRDLCVQNERD